VKQLLRKIAPGAVDAWKRRRQRRLRDEEVRRNRAVLRDPGTLQSLTELAEYLVCRDRKTRFSFLEIGVFKADNALRVLGAVRDYGVTVAYTGFDLFDDIDHLKEHHPGDYEQYTHGGGTYWEFESQGHTYRNVVAKLSAALKTEEYRLIAGDTTQTLPAFVSDRPEKTDLVFIDGCHDYDVVKSDWQHCETLFDANPGLAIAFDDYTYEGVRAVFEEIAASGKYRLVMMNDNQFYLTRP
jgi:hypothetical protein